MKKIITILAVIFMVSCNNIQKTDIGDENHLIVEKVTETKSGIEVEVWSRRIESGFVVAKNSHEGFAFTFYAEKNMFKVGDTVRLVNNNTVTKMN